MEKGATHFTHMFQPMTGLTAEKHDSFLAPVSDGKAITDRKLTTTASVDLPELRKTLTSYLDTFVATKGPFPRQIRPMDMRDLRVVAFVQDDETNEILNAVQVGVEP